MRTVPAAPAPEELRLLTVERFCARYSVSRSTAFRLIRSGALPSVKLGASRRIPVDGAERFVASLTVTDGTAA